MGYRSDSIAISRDMGPLRPNSDPHPKPHSPNPVDRLLRAFPNEEWIYLILGILDLVPMFSKENWQSGNLLRFRGWGSEFGGDKCLVSFVGIWASEILLHLYWKGGASSHVVSDQWLHWPSLVLKVLGLTSPLRYIWSICRHCNLGLEGRYCWRRPVARKFIARFCRHFSRPKAKVVVAGPVTKLFTSQWIWHS